jgi:hypothetical protein
MNIDECLKSCPSGVDMVSWVRDNWNTPFTFQIFMEKQAKNAICPRCHKMMDIVEIHEEGKNIRFVFECKIHNNKNNPVMKYLLGEDHEFFKK